MQFLQFDPTVFVIENHYEILCNATQNGVFAVRVGNKTYYEENAGVLASEKPYAKIRIPQRALNEVGEYSVVFRASLQRRSYFSQMGEEQAQSYAFRPLCKTSDIHMYHVADIHGRFDLAEQCADYFGDDLDVLAVNGDLCELNAQEDFLRIFRFLGNISHGKTPVLFSRGNHDVRGRSAERYARYFPCNNGKTYYAFSLGCLHGVVFDCGEDKNDDYIGITESGAKQSVYAGLNVFASFRKRQTEFLRRVRLPRGGIPFAMGHVCPVQTTLHKGDCFDIERKTYAKWNEAFERLGIRFMLCGHIHKAYILPPDASESTLRHNYPVVVGSQCAPSADPPTLWGAAITLQPHGITVRFTDNAKNVLSEHAVAFG